MTAQNQLYHIDKLKEMGVILLAFDNLNLHVILTNCEAHHTPSQYRVHITE